MLVSLNGKILLDKLNLSLDSYKIKLKALFAVMKLRQLYGRVKALQEFAWAVPVQV